MESEDDANGIENEDCTDFVMRQIIDSLPTHVKLRLYDFRTCLL